MRDDRELERIAAFIENNPVNAGLVADPCCYAWSSAWSKHGELKLAAAR